MLVFNNICGRSCYTLKILEHLYKTMMNLDGAFQQRFPANPFNDEKTGVISWYKHKHFPSSFHLEETRRPRSKFNSSFQLTPSYSAWNKSSTGKGLPSRNGRNDLVGIPTRESTRGLDVPFQMNPSTERNFDSRCGCCRNDFHMKFISMLSPIIMMQCHFRSKAVMENYPIGNVIPGRWEELGSKRAYPNAGQDILSLQHCVQQPGQPQQHQYLMDSGCRNSKKLFGCRRCSYITDRKNNLKRHVLAMHKKSDRLLECCGVAFDSKAALRDHVIAYHETGYACIYCRRNFCRKALLKRHMAVHGGRKDYACDRCDYETSHKSNLERHRKIHQQCIESTSGRNGSCEQATDSTRLNDGTRLSASPCLCSEDDLIDVLF